MGRKLTQHTDGAARDGKQDRNQADRIRELQERFRALGDGDGVCWTSRDAPPDLTEIYLEDVLAFESVESGTSLFDGLQERGIDLPRPENLNEFQSARKSREVLRALARIGVVLIGFEHMSAREFYSTLWNETLWEGCYVEKRIPGAITIIDVSHAIPRSDMIAFMESLRKTGSVH